MALDRTKLLEDAERAARRGDLGKAAQCYRQLVDARPRDKHLLQKLGDALARAGEDDEARGVIERLADLYHGEGDRQRALALLKRAVRLGEPTNDLLGKLATWLLDAGLKGDAREPLREAARRWEEGGEASKARELHLRYLDVVPTDREALAEVLRLAAAGTTVTDCVSLSLRVALGFARARDVAGVSSAAAAAFAAGPEDPVALGRLPDFVRAAVRAGAPLDESLEQGLEGAARHGYAVLRAGVLRELGRPAEAIAALSIARQVGGWRPAALLAAGRELIELGDVDGARSSIMSASQGAEGDGALRDAVVEALSLLLTRHPGLQDAMARLIELQPGLPSAPSSAEEGAGDSGPVATSLSAESRARLLEAESMLSHGLPERALEAVQEIPFAERELPEVADVLARAESAVMPLAPARGEARSALEALTENAGGEAARALPAEPAPAPEEPIAAPADSNEPVAAPAPEPAAEPVPAPAPIPAPPPEDLDGDDWEIDLDLEDEAGESAAAPSEATTTQPTPIIPAESAPGGRAAAPPAGAPVPTEEPAPSPAEADAPVEAASAPARPKRGGAGGLALDTLEEQLDGSAPDDDVETRYQMAIGLLEMGLEEQAGPLLEPIAAAHGSRAPDAALILFKLRLKQERRDEALALASAAIAAGEVGAPIEELLALSCQLALKQGQKSLAGEHLSELERQAPGYPHLGSLRKLLEASKN